ncbi:HEAT repeat-containing protein 5B-like isoform X1 [Apostichopus japonicus]|uniref:HEAT repeat-containing protein 5B-like isoform X1 n=2 Tax=Stichopus japonicus TaxID=307972 RepID=UPI003AB491D9
MESWSKPLQFLWRGVNSGRHHQQSRSRSSEEDHDSDEEPVMELAHSLLLNEEALAQIADSKKPIFVFEWLRFLDKVLVAANKSDIKQSQETLVKQLNHQISQSPGPPTRKLLGRCLANLYSIGDTYKLFETVNLCNDIIKSRDDSPSFLPSKLAAIAVLGCMYEKLGRMMGSSYPETIQNLIKALKNAESTGRCEIMYCLQMILQGLGSAAQSHHRDINKALKSTLQDRSMAVRCAASASLQELVVNASFLQSSELDNTVTACFRSLDGSNYDVRSSVAKLLAVLLSTTQTNPPQDPKAKKISRDEMFNLLSAGFVRGPSGFLRGGSGEVQKGNRDVRVGVTHAYVQLVQNLGGLWLERNLSFLIRSVLDLVANPRATQSHVDAVYSRRCVSFILRSTLGGMLGEKAQVSAGKDVCGIIAESMNASANLSDSDSRSQANGYATSQHALICCLHELGCLLKQLSTCALPLLSETTNNVCDVVLSVLLHPGSAARLAAAWCLSCLVKALPSQLTPMLDRCISRLVNCKSSPDAVSGYSFGIAALLGSVRDCPLGIPHTKGKQIFGLAEDLLRTASQNSRMSLHRTQASWLILGGIMTLGTPTVKNHLPRLLLLWRNAFPRSSKELESEKARGDAFTWQVTLEGRAGALCAMQSFIRNCPELVTDDVIRRLTPPLECALCMLAEVYQIIRANGAHLKACAAMVRLRLYQVLQLIPARSYEGSFTILLRELVAEFTLTDNPANTTTSYLRSLCHENDSIILQSWIQDTDHKSVELQLQPNSASGSGALEHDPSSLFWIVEKGEIPGPLPLGVAVIDASVILFGYIIPHVADKHKLKIMDHFGECIRQAKSARQQAIQINVFAAVLSALKALDENKHHLQHPKIRSVANGLIMGALNNPNPILRCAAGEAVGRMAQVGGETSFIAQTAQMCFDKLKTARDVVSRTGNSLALGCLHRYVGGMGAGQHLNTSVSILLALAQDATSPEVQMWALHALALIADSGGPMFRSYVEPTLSLVLTLLLSVPPANSEVHQCLGHCLASLITTLGPELQGNRGNTPTARTSCLVACAIMQDHPDSLVGAEAIACLQQLHMFAPRHVNLSSVVPHLVRTLGSPHLLLRRASMACLRQLAQREAKEVSQYAMTLAVDSKDVTHTDHTQLIVTTESGLEGALFAMLDRENDTKLRSSIHDTLTSMLQELAAGELARWLSLCKVVLSASTDSSSANPSPEVETAEDKEEKDEDDDDVSFKTGEKVITHPTVPPRWSTRVFAAESVRRVIQVCEGNTVHFDLAMAREMRRKTGRDNYLVLHLSDLVRIAFIAATSDSTQLRNAGLLLLQEVINKFAKVPDPEFEGHFILEQYQAQVGAALRPAFAADTPSDVTAMACQVSSVWIGSGAAIDLNDLKRVHQLLVSSLAKLKVGKGAPVQLYSESASTMEKLAVIKAWAEVYVVAMKQHLSAKPSNNKTNELDDPYRSSDNLLTLVKNELRPLSRYWLAALRDHALLALPPDFQGQLPSDGGAFYNPEATATTRPHYQKAWAPIVYAAALWLNNGGFDIIEDNAEGEYGSPAFGGPLLPGMLAPMMPKTQSRSPEDLKSDYFHLVLGICIESLSSPRTTAPIEHVTHCLEALQTLLLSPWPRNQLAKDQAVTMELLNVLHRLLLTRETLSTHLQVVNVVRQIIRSIQEDLERQGKEKEIASSDSSSSSSFGEGGESGEIAPGKSVVFAALEVCLCLLVRQLPALNPSITSHAAMQNYSKNAGLSEEASAVICGTIGTLTELPSLCSPKGTTSILPTILFLTTNVLRETAETSPDGKVSACVTACIQALRALVTSKFVLESSCSDDWLKYLRSTLATLLEFGKEDPDRPRMDICTVLLSVAVYVASSPPEVVCVPQLLEQNLELFKSSFQTGNVMVKLKCLQAVCTIIQCPHQEISTPFIHAIGPKLVEHLQAITSRSPESLEEVALILEGIRSLEILVALTDDSHKAQLLTLLLPIMVSCIVESSQLAGCSKQARALHDQVLQRVIKIGHQYQLAFRTVITASPDLKNKLEAAIRAQSASSMKAKQQQQLRQQQKSALPAAPSIKLKMDFSNFTG